jgi:hypothetical protein
MSEQVATDLLDRTPYIVDVLGATTGDEEVD